MGSTLFDIFFLDGNGRTTRNVRVWTDDDATAAMKAPPAGTAAVEVVLWQWREDNGRRTCVGKRFYPINGDG